MVNYNIVKYCKSCNVRFLVKKGESRKYYCDECYSKLNAENKTEEVRT